MEGVEITRMGDRQRQMECTGTISAIGIGSADQTKSVRLRVGGTLHDPVVIMHIASCVHNYYATTDEVFTVENIVGVFGHKDARFFLVKWDGYEEPEWEREHLLKRDKCHDIIRSFWATSGLRLTANTRFLFQMMMAKTGVLCAAGLLRDPRI